MSRYAKRTDQRFATLDSAMEVARDSDKGYAVKCSPEVHAELGAVERSDRLERC